MATTSSPTDTTEEEIPDYRLTGFAEDEEDNQGNPTPGATYRKAMKADLRAMIVGKEVFDFYGAHSNYFKLGHGKNTMVFEVLEDPSDGYRSYYATTIIAKDPGGFFQTPIARVRMTMRKTKGDPFYVLVDDLDKHLWLKFGTADSHDLYPSFVFFYQPKMEGNTGPAT